MTKDSSEGYQWWVEEPAEKSVSNASDSGYQWWVDESPIADTINTPPASGKSAIGNINLLDYMPKPGVYADPLFAEPIALEDAFDSRMLADLERDKCAGKIVDYQLYDGLAQDTENWGKIKAGRDFTIIPPYIVLITPVAEAES